MDGRALIAFLPPARSAGKFFGLSKDHPPGLWRSLAILKTTPLVFDDLFWSLDKGGRYQVASISALFA